MRKTQIMAHLPNPTDATGYYRGTSPLGALSEMHEHFDVSFIQDYQPWYADIYNLFFLQRPFTEPHLEAMIAAQHSGLPVWIDYDDDLMSINTENPGHQIFGQKRVKETIKRLLSSADLVTVSTDTLQKKLSSYNDKVVTVPNALCERVNQFRERGPKQGDQKPKRVYWRGGSSHERDMRHYSDIVVDCVEQFTKWQWLFMGYSPWFIYDRITEGRATQVEWFPVTRYYRSLLKEDPALCVVPLHDNEFNRAKSNIAWLEASMAGAACLAPRWDSWKYPGVIHYDSQSEFEDKLKKCLSGEIDLASHAKISWEHVSKNFMLSQVNPKRFEIIQELLCQSRS